MNLFSRQRLGKRGEDIASAYLKKQGFKILERNFKARYGEIDIIALKDGTLVFVEVKTRVGNQFGTPEEAVTPKKLREIVKTSAYYMLLHPELPESVRVDVIGIQLTGDKVTYFNHTQNVTM